MTAPLQTLTPDAVDRLYRRLAVVTAPWDQELVTQRWTHATSETAELPTLIRLAQWSVGQRVRELLDHQVTADGIRGIAAMCLHRVALPEPARLGQLLADCAVPDRHLLMKSAELHYLPRILAAIRMPDDPEGVRTPFVTDWFRESTRAGDTHVGDARDRAGTRQAVIDTVTRSAPPGWTAISGTLCAAAGIARANLRVSHPDGDVGIAAPVHVPALHQLRQIDAATGAPWWCAMIDADAAHATLTPAPATTVLAPMDLMRPSEYRAEAAVTGVSLPDWLTESCGTGDVAGTRVLAPAAATEAALIELDHKGITVDARRTMIERTDDGYRVRAAAGTQVHTLGVTDRGTVIILGR